MSNLNANQVQLGNIVRTEVGEYRVIGGVYGSVESYYLLDVHTLTYAQKQDSIEDLFYGAEILSIRGVDAMDYTITLEEDEPRVGDVFVALVNDEDGEPEMEVRQIIGLASGDKFFAIDPVTGARRTRTKDSVEEVINSYDKVIVL